VILRIFLTTNKKNKFKKSKKRKMILYLVDALMISIGRPLALIGTLQGIQQTSAKLASTVSQIPAGIFASYSLSFQNNQTQTLNNTTLISFNKNNNRNKYIFLIAAVCPIILFFATLITVRERRRKLNKNNFSRTWSSLIGIFRYKRFWLITIFLFLYSAAPQVKTALFYYQRDILQFDPFYVSILNTLYNGCGIISALLYLSIFSFYPTKRVLRIAIVMRMFAVASYLFAKNKFSSICVAIFTGFCSEITNLALLHLAAKSCPKNIEGTLFALFVSCVNFGAATGDWLGSIIYEKLGFITLIIIAIVWIGTTILATCHIGEYGIKSTLDDDDDDDDNEDKYHYYDTIIKGLETIEDEEFDEKEPNDKSEQTEKKTLMI
jgi:Na+/melibiose symporter-like transporter